MLLDRRVVEGVLRSIIEVYPEPVRDVVEAADLRRIDVAPDGVQRRLDRHGQLQAFPWSEILGVEVRELLAPGILDDAGRLRLELRGPFELLVWNPLACSTMLLLASSSC